ncbi:MAG: nitroreductase family protein [Faecalibacterium sp.]|nr:nitroreductase family protein [Faecalibacterium sp.]
MEFYEAIQKRRTVRDLSDEPIDPQILKRILSAGFAAPSNDHMRDWHFIVLTDRQVIQKVVGKIPKTVSPKRVEFIMRSWRLNDECQQKMYADAIPKQYQMLLHAGCVVLPLFKQKGNLLAPRSLSALNAFASMWCCIENIFLAATAENYACNLRIPLGDEAQYIQKELNLPDDYALPCYIGIGKPKETFTAVAQKEIEIEHRIHFNQW